MITFINKSKSAFYNIFKILMCKLFNHFHVCYWLAEPRNVRLHPSYVIFREWGQDDKLAECAIGGTDNSAEFFSLIFHEPLNCLGLFLIFSSLFPAGNSKLSIKKRPRQFKGSWNVREKKITTFFLLLYISKQAIFHSFPGDSAITWSGPYLSPL